jgi:hypothetical protein
MRASVLQIRTAADPHGKPNKNPDLEKLVKDGAPAIKKPQRDRRLFAATALLELAPYERQPGKKEPAT